MPGLKNLTLVMCLMAAWFALKEADWWMNLEQLCEHYGFEYEDYQVTTEDGYILTIQRIRGPLGEDNSEKQPMYLSRPFGNDETVMFLVGPDESPGFRLAKEYDLWLLNPRGNILSREHTTLDNTSREYWSFDVNDMTLDHRAVAPLILQETGFSKFHVYGYSSGGLSLAYAVALYPEYFNSVIRTAQYVATSFTLAQTTTTGIQIGASIPQMMRTLERLGIYTLQDDNDLLQNFQGSVCSFGTVFCMMFQGLTLGEINPVTDNPKGYDNMLYRGFSGLATHLVEHFIQSYRTKEVTWFDYGIQGNLEAYGTETPPLIDYSLHDFPCALYYSPDDGSADMADAQWAADILGDNVALFNSYPGQTHCGFCIGREMTFLDDMLEFLPNYPIERVAAASE